MSVETSPLLCGFEPGDVAVWCDDRAALKAISAARFCGAAQALAHRLPPSRYAVNYCDDPLRFLVASAGALTAGQTLLLPQSRAEHSAAALLRRYADACCLVDEPTTAAVGRIHLVGGDVLDAAAAWPPPTIERARVAAILFTSGTTGDPEPQAKTWSALVAGARTFAGTFGAPTAGDAILGTVAPQHMFGFETTVVAPWQCGRSVVAARPMFPADLRDVLERAADAGIAGVWLMTTPLQLRVLHAGMKDGSQLRRVIVSTMPLGTSLAAAVEHDWDVPVDEIYGCTEGGMLAVRRTAAIASFAPATGLSFAIDEDGTARVRGDQLASPLTLADRLHWSEDMPAASVGDARADAAMNRRFVLIGRDAEMVKIAGRRTTLPALTAQLLAIPGVQDGAFFLPAPDAERTCAIAVAPSHTLASLRAELAGRIDAAFLPRPLALVAALPRNPQGKLARAKLVELARLAPTHDADGGAAGADVAGIGGDEHAPIEVEDAFVAACTISADHPALPGHFPGRPLVPGVVLLERVDALLRKRGLRIRECMHVKFLTPVAPLEALSLRVEIDATLTARFTIHRAQRLAVSGALRCAHG